MSFGDRIVVEATLKRKFVRKEINGQMRWLKAWVEGPIKQKNAIFLGFRRLSNGFRDYDNEYGYTYYPHEYFKAALVCFGEHSNPCYVPLNAIVA